MKLVLISNYLNTHMIPLCDAFSKHQQIEEFTFVATTPFGNERKQMGFEDENEKNNYVLKAYKSSELYDKALQLASDADVAIIAHAPEAFVHIRMKKNKLTFLCSERFYKLGLWRRFLPTSYIKKKNRFLQYRNKELYFLTIGAYMPFDLHFVGFPLEKCFQWAYFPEIQPMSEEQLGEKNSEAKLKLFWAGRMLNTKHPETAIKIANHLKKEKINFELTMAGDGPELANIKHMVKKNNLNDTVCLLGNCSPDVVQQYMQQSDIFLFTSDYCEGWGAVLSEAMGAGCVPIASSAAGATEILIEHNKNGAIYHTEKEAEAFATMLAHNPDIRKQLAYEAYQTIHKVWTAEAAVNYFVNNCIYKKSIEVAGPMHSAILRNPQNYISTSF